MFLLYTKEDVSSVVKTASEFDLPSSASHVAIQATDATIRYTLDEETPSASKGLRLLVGKKPRILLIDDFARIKFVREASTDAVLHAHFVGGRNVRSVDFNWEWSDGSLHLWADENQAGFSG